MRDLTRKLFACLFLASASISLRAQVSAQSTAASSSSLNDARTTQLEEKLQTISSALATTRQQLDQSQQELQSLRDELAQIKKQLASTQPANPSPDLAGNTSGSERKTVDLEERQDTLEAQVKLHEQTKVESVSKYPIRLTGLILFNAFANRGAVDNLDFPSIAIRQTPDSSGGSVGATFRQTILGIEGNGPRIAGARTSADVSMDFFGGLAYSNFGTSSGVVRMRTASINLDWTRDSVQAGMVNPLVSPLSPTSYATIAEPGLAWAGNLWTWAPQLKVSHRFLLQDERQVQLEFGLWDPPAAGYNASDVFRAPSPGEQAKQPGYETRVSFGKATGEHSFQLGLGGYYSRQRYPSNKTNDSWAATADWRVPLTHRFEVSGEAYRGRSLGGLGGGAYKDVVYGINPISGLPALRGLNAIGGWTQVKSRFGASLEANAVVGQDSGYAGDFHALVLPATASATQLRARNRMVVGNLIFRPKTYLIFSPEYRRIWTWPIFGAANTADVFTLSMGYEF
jgi:hypothetical protein